MPDNRCDRNLKKEDTSYVYARTGVMRAWSKCLIWFAALLLPLQALQGTPFLCQFAGCGHRRLVSAHNDQADQSARCQCQRQIAHLSPAGDSRQRRAAQALGCLGQTVPQQNCPPGCFCRRPAQPQSQPTTPLEWKFVNSLDLSAVDQAHTRCSDLLDGCNYAQREVSATASAQELCASLCRFTT